MKRVLVWMATLMLALVTVFTACTSNGDTDGEQDAPTGEGANAYYTVEFNSNGGSEVQSARVLAGNPVRRPTPPVRAGYFLNGWYTDAQTSAENEWDFERDRVNSDLTLYAGWTANESVQPTDSLTYQINDAGTGYIVTGAGEETVLVIPAEHEGLPVTEIQGHHGTGAFASSAITSVVIPDSVEVIGQNSFYGCNSLTQVIIGAESKLKEMGNNAFSGCDLLESIYLPASLVTLGNNVFNNCGGMQEFVVAEGNSMYRAENGHLIERASNTLLRGANNANVPEGVTTLAVGAFRRANGITQLNLPTSVTNIGNYFIADSTITEINYAGTQQQWDAIEKSERMWNYGNRDVVVNFEASIADAQTEVLVVYFSATGNTEGVAQEIAQQAKAALWEITAATPYTAQDINYTITNCRANVEQRDENARPELAGSVPDFAKYDIIFVGYPIWQGIAPLIIQTFLEGNDFTGKQVYTFSTSASSSGSRAHSALVSAYPQIALQENLHFTSGQLSSAQSRVKDWLVRIGLA